jgi:hypothetical protein
VLVDDDEAVAIRSLEDTDNPLINDVSDDLDRCGVGLILSTPA